MAELNQSTKSTMYRLRWPLGLTRLGMVAERATVAFWPLLSVVFLVLAALMFGLHQVLPLELAWGAAVLSILGALGALVFAVRRFRWPSADEAQARLDETLPGRPIAAILDDQAIGSDDPTSVAVWDTHVKRMAARAAKAQTVAPDLRVSRRDPYALRYVALLALMMAGLFGSVLRVASVSELVSGTGGAYATGPAWEGWVEPPAYTGKPSIYLADIRGGELTVPAGSKLTLRLYGKIGSLTAAETISGRTGDVGSAAEPNQSFDMVQSGSLAIEGAGGRSWKISITPDTAPTIELGGEVERRASGDMHLPFSAQDDYGVRSGYGELVLDLASVDRRYGLVAEPEPREMITLDLPMPFNGDRTAFAETLVDNLADHPWAGLPVRVSLFALDAGENLGAAEPEVIDLPGRRFFDPLAAAIVEQRRYLLWSKLNAPSVAQVLRAVSNRPEDFFDSSTVYLKLRVVIRRLETGFTYSDLSADLQEETAGVLWDIALQIEDGNLADAQERLRRAQDRLDQAMRDGASDDEIAQLMEELRQAMQDYMQQLAEQQGDQQQNDSAQNQDMQEVTPEQLQSMLDRLQELMEQGRMAEAQELLDQLRQMMENLQVAQGQGQQSPGQQALNDLGDTLREQQGLNDDTFGDLQDQFGEQGEQQGSQQGQQGQQDQQGEQGDGQGGQQGQQGQRGQSGQQGQGQQPGSGEGRGTGNEAGQGLAQRQQALRDQLNRQTQNLPGRGTPSGDAAREALGRAGQAMDGAEQDLRENDFAGALDNQSEALEALREGMRELADQLAQQQNRQNGQQGQANGRAQNENQRDPLGRDLAGNGRVGTDEQLLQGEDVYRRAQELLREIRRRSAEQERPEIELDYLKRLLDQF